jgi:hypothetical protein
VRYIKEDSCFDTSNNTLSLLHYATMRDALNATGVSIFFSMCWGAGATIAEPGRTLGNGWRIDEVRGDVCVYLPTIPWHIHGCVGQRKCLSLCVVDNFVRWAE